MATGTGVGTIRRLRISVGAIVITVGFVGVSQLVEATERNDEDKFGIAEDDDTAPTVLEINDIPKTWSLDDGVFGNRVRGTIGRLSVDLGGRRRVRLDRPVRNYKTAAQ